MGMDWTLPLLGLHENMDVWLMAVSTMLSNAQGEQQTSTDGRTKLVSVSQKLFHYYLSLALEPAPVLCLIRSICIDNICSMPRQRLSEQSTLTLFSK